MKVKEMTISDVHQTVVFKNELGLGHKALGTTLPEQKTATRASAKAIADLVEDGANVVISHSNAVALQTTATHCQYQQPLMPCSKPLLQGLRI